MKYIIAIVLAIIITLLILPVILITWSVDGWEEMMEGIQKICGIDDWD